MGTYTNAFQNRFQKIVIKMLIMESSFVIYLIKNKKTDRTVKTDQWKAEQWKADQQKQNSEKRISEKYRKEKEITIHK